MIARTNRVFARTTDPPIIEIHGNLDGQCGLQLLEAVREVGDKTKVGLCIDCTSLESADDFGVSALIEAQRIVDAAKGKLHLLFPPAQLTGKLHVIGCARKFEITDIVYNGHPCSSSPPESWRTGEFAIPASPESVAGIRHNVVRLAKTMPFTEDEIEDIVLAVGEAASNAVRYGSPLGPANRVSVCCERSENRFAVQISDEGLGFDPYSRRCEEYDSLVEGGRGLVIMRMLMDEVTFTFDRGTTVRLVKHVRSAKMLPSIR